MENFKELPISNSYLVSNSGEVYSLLTNKLLKSRPNTSGYLQVGLTIGHLKFYLVSRLVASTYLGLDINDLSLEVDHMDTIITNNAVSNLQILTKEQHKLKTLSEYNCTRTKVCSICASKFRDTTIDSRRVSCAKCRPRYAAISVDITLEIEIVNKVKELGSWKSAGAYYGISDNGLRKRYKTCSGGKNPSLVRNLPESHSGRLQ